MVLQHFLYSTLYSVSLSQKFDLKTPGREDDDVEAEKKADLGSSDYTAVAAAILEGVGGAANVKSIDNCITRLRLEVKDSSLGMRRKSSQPVLQVLSDPAKQLFRLSLEQRFSS